LAQTDLRNLKKFGPHPQKRLDKSRFRTYTGAGDTLRKSSSYYYWRPRAKNENNSHLRIVLICESFSFANRSHLRIVLICESFSFGNENHSHRQKQKNPQKADLLQKIPFRGFG
jgi:hypothetical protein